MAEYLDIWFLRDNYTHELRKLPIQQLVSLVFFFFCTGDPEQIYPKHFPWLFASKKSEFTTDHYANSFVVVYLETRDFFLYLCITLSQLIFWMGSFWDNCAQKLFKHSTTNFISGTYTRISNKFPTLLTRSGENTTSKLQMLIFDKEMLKFSM